MMATREISNRDDIIDSRDVIERIEELREERDDLRQNAEETGDAAALRQWEEEYGDELAALEKLAEQAEGYAADWEYGETLIHDSYFRDYAEELAEDIGALKRELANQWPYTCIDWDAAAEELKQDYTEVDFDGVTYWIR